MYICIIYIGPKCIENSGVDSHDEDDDLLVGLVVGLKPGGYRRYRGSNRSPVQYQIESGERDAMLKGEGEDDEGSAAPESITRDNSLPDWAEDEKCIRGECVHYSCEMRQEESSEEDSDNDDNNSAEDKATGREVDLGSERVDEEEWREVSYRGRRASPDPVTTRKIPSLGSYAKPLLSDLRYSWVTEDRNQITVFYPPEIPLEKVKRAMGLMDDPFDWSVLRPTAPKYNKWVYFPPLEK